MRTLAIAFTMVLLSWHAEAQTARRFDNDRVVAWRLAPGERAEPQFAEGPLPGVIVPLADGAVRIVDDVNTAATSGVATAVGRRALRDQGASQRQSRDAARTDTGFSARGGQARRRERPRGGLARDLDEGVEDAAALSRHGCGGDLP